MGLQGQNRGGGGGLRAKRDWLAILAPARWAQHPRAAAGSAEERALPPHSGGDWGGLLPLLRPSPAFSLRRSLAEGRPSGGPSQAIGGPLILHNVPHPSPRAGEGRSGGSCTPRVAGKAADGHRTKHPKAAIKRGPAPAHSWPPRSGPALLLEKATGAISGMPVACRPPRRWSPGLHPPRR